MTPAIDLYIFVERNVFDTDASWLDALAELAAMHVPGLALQVRTRTEPPDRTLELARRAREVIRDARVPVLLNGSTEDALALGYDGVHWPEALIPPASNDEGRLPKTVRGEPVEPREHAGPSGDAAEGTQSGAMRPSTSSGRTVLGSRGFITGASVHSPEAATRAEAAGADLVVAGTIFDAGSKPVTGEGLEKLRRIAGTRRLPVLAIGGVRPDRVPACIEAGASGVAVVTSVLRAPDMAAAVRELRGALDAANGSRHVAATFRPPRRAS